MAAMIRAATFHLVVFALGAAACGTAQSPECKQYIDCRHAFDEEAGNTRADLAAYEMDGDCWVDGSAASDCTETCKEQLASLQEDVADADYDLTACE